MSILITNGKAHFEYFYLQVIEGSSGQVSKIKIPNLLSLQNSKGI
jgi:hypothetical protein